MTVRDNGRGIPVDPHPRFPDKSALEVILCTLHAGGKFSGKAYQTSGGLHGVGVSVVNALSDRLVVEVARNRQLWRQEYSRGHADGAAARRSGRCRTGAGRAVTFHPDPEIFGASAHFKPARLLRMVRSKAYLFSGVEIRWRCDPACIAAGRRHAGGGDVPLSRRARPTISAERLEGAQCYADRPFAGKVDFAERFGAGDRRVGRVGGQLDAAARRLRLVLLQHHPDARGRHARGGVLGGDPAGASAATASSRSNRKAAAITREDVMAGGSAMISVFIREPEFVGQTKDRLATQEAARLVEDGGARPVRPLAGGRHADGRGDPRLSGAEGRGAAAAAGREGDERARPR